MLGFTTLVLITMLLVGFGVLENVSHRRNLLRIPIRVHVNGTRGKSSVTRLIAAGLREGQVAVCAKTTGTLPRMIFPDGSELPVFRASRANIIEQKRIVAIAVDHAAKVLVLECMALQPALQALSEIRLIRATHSVITNARPDHLDVMGPTEADVARALAGTVAVKGKLFTAEERHVEILKQAALDRETTFHALSPAEVLGVSETELAAFSYTEHADNVALALSVCADLGVGREVALRGMQKTPADPGAMTEHQLDFFGRHLMFFNAFAANDPVSTEKLWQLALLRAPATAERIALFNCRADRADRSVMLAEACASWSPPTCIVLMGSGTHHFARAAVRAGMDGSGIVFVEGLRVEEIFEHLLERAKSSAVIVGMGNIGGGGLDLARFFSNRALLARAGQERDSLKQLA